MVKLLDCTLRDGSYVIDYQFTAQDTATISSLLDAQGVPFIEIGHGMGLDASSDPSRSAACSDEEYLQAGAESVKKGMWGMFFIPGIGKQESISRAAKYGMKFLRIGTNVTEVENAEKYVRHAKELGLYVSCNFMKTYALPPDEVGKRVAQAAAYGADIVSIVDSAGGMFPEDVEAYFSAARRYTDLPLGFHGHNNLGLVIANALKAIDLGAEMVDVSLRGIGRSAGNAATEIILLALKKKGMDLGIDPLKIMDIAESKIDGIMKWQQSFSSIGIVSGYAQFHSSFIGSVMKYADSMKVDPRKLIIALCEENKVNAPEELVRRKAEELSALHVSTSETEIPLIKKSDARCKQEKIALVVNEAKVTAKKHTKTSVLNIVQSDRMHLHDGVSTSVYEGAQFVVASIEVNDLSEACDLCRAIDPKPDIFFVDHGSSTESNIARCAELENVITGAKVLFYNDAEIWGKSVALFTMQKIKEGHLPFTVLLKGKTRPSQACAYFLKEAGCTVDIFPESDKEKHYSAILLFESNDDNILQHISSGGFLVDGLIGACTPSFLKTVFERAIPAYRPDMRIMIHNEIATVNGMRNFSVREAGKGEIKGIPIAAGGVLVPKGTVIVDSISATSKVLGVADGGGFLILAPRLSEREQEHLEAVARALL